MPSRSASSISSGSAGISSGDSSAMTVTSSTPARRAARATSRVVVIAAAGVVVGCRTAREPVAGRRGSGRGRAQRGAGGVERDVAAADDDDPLAELDAEALVDVEEELDRAQHAVEVVAGQVEVAAHARCPTARNSASWRSSSSSIVCVSPIRRDSVSTSMPELDDRLDLPGDERARQPVLGDAEHHHPAEPVVRLVDRDRDGRRGAGRTRRRARRARRRSRRPTGTVGRRHRAVRLVPDRVRREALDPEPLGDEPLQRPDRDRRVDRAPPARRSHGAAHTRPQIDANGFGARAMRYASWNRPSAIAVT